MDAAEWDKVNDTRLVVATNTWKDELTATAAGKREGLEANMMYVGISEPLWRT